MAEIKFQDLLVEIGTEELPPAALKNLGHAFHEAVVKGLQAAPLGGDFSDSRWFATPRRLAVLIPKLADKQPRGGETRVGPFVEVAFDKNGNPTDAAKGFARSVGAQVEDLEETSTNKGKRLCYHIVKEGRSSFEIVPEVVQEALDRLPVPKRMRWGSGDFAFVRPVHWIVMLLGDELIEASLFGVRSGRVSYGHRAHHPDPVNLEAADDYEDALRSAKVIADFRARRERVREQVEALATRDGERALEDDALLDEVTALTEWPVAISGEFDERFLDLPPEVITTTLVHHQKFFPVLDGNGQPTTRFAAVANIESRHPETVSQGYERVIRPRLADAAFFYEQDRQRRLADRREALKGMLFQKQLGSIYDKSERVRLLAGGIAEQLDMETAPVERAAVLAKCDLTTLMVGEFPELQGIMGGYYATHDGEADSVARAIAEHYRPRFAGDELPTERIGQILAIADKLDTVCAIFMAGDRPTGNKDPFALRRSALGLLRILVECELPLDLESSVDDACRVVAEHTTLDADASQRAEIVEFCIERLRSWYRDQGIRADVLAAVIGTGVTRPLDLHLRLRAVNHFVGLPEAASLATANKRIRNILKQADGGYPDSADAGLMDKAEEKALKQAMDDKRAALDDLLTRDDYQGALTELAGLRESVDAFFDHVMVMAENKDKRRNRLALLADMQRMFGRIADISRLDIGGD